MPVPKSLETALLFSLGRSGKMWNNPTKHMDTAFDSIMKYKSMQLITECACLFVLCW